jgi:opacity protein-like surface antigen
MRTGFLALLSIVIAPAWAQNSDLGFLVGVSPLKAQSSISGGTISSSTDANIQFDYSFQFRQTEVGAFYIELPLAAVFHESSRVGPNIVSSDQNIIFFTPGVRWKLWVHSRFSLYAALGGGFASFGANTSIVGSGISNVSNRTTAAAMDFGAGIDFRVTRLLSIRCEGRDYVTRSNAGGFSGSNHAALDVGVGFHF